MPKCHTFFILCIVIFFSTIYNLRSTYASSGPVDQSSSVQATVPSRQGAGDSTPPTIPILIRPFDGFVMNDTTPELVWHRSTDPNGNYVAYTVYIDGVATYLGVSNAGNSAKENYTSYIEGNEVRLSALNIYSEGSYNWRVVAYDLSGNESSSTTWSFTIDTTPPPITVTDLDIYHNLALTSLDPSSVPSNTPYQVAGPKDVYLTLTTESYTNVNLTILDLSGNVLYNLYQDTGNFGSLTFYQYLALGDYYFSLSAVDHAGLITVMPPIRVSVVQSLINLPIPGVSPTPTIAIPPGLHDLPTTLTQLPSTIARVSSRYDLAIIYVVLLAVIIVVLLIYLWGRYNLLLIDAKLEPLSSCTVTHWPGGKSREYRYTLKPRPNGKLYLPRLTRGSVLSLSYSSGTRTLCLVLDKPRYTLYLT